MFAQLDGSSIHFFGLGEFSGNFRDLYSRLWCEGENRGPQVQNTYIYIYMYIHNIYLNARAAQPRFSPVFEPFCAQGQG